MLLVEAALELRLQGRHPRRLGCYTAVTACCCLKQAAMLSGCFGRRLSAFSLFCARQKQAVLNWAGHPLARDWVNSGAGFHANSVTGASPVHVCVDLMEPRISNSYTDYDSLVYAYVYVYCPLFRVA